VTDEKKPPASPAQPAAPAEPPPPDPAVEAKTRIDSLKANVNTTRQELIHLRGLILNRDPELAKKLEKENQDLAARVRDLEKCLHGLLQEAMSPRNDGEEKTRYEVIRSAAIEHLKKTNVNPDLWKSLES
jgi:hypothetical protein